jgi:Zn-dependent protease/predicted transcriptional regulator
VIRGSFTLGRIAGVRIGIDYTWLLAFALVSWSLAAGYFPQVLPGEAVLTYWTLGTVGALMLFACVLLHELSHSLVARRRGLHVDSITLFIFGGVSNLSSEMSRPGDEFVVAVVGPLTSLALAGIASLVGQSLASGNAVIGALLGYLAFANAMLGAFNLVPGFPLDGGRLLRAAVWAISGSLRQATTIASYTGQTLGYLLVLLGVSTLLGGDGLSGLWMVLIGWFLSGAAASTREEQVAREVLSGIAVSTVMDTTPPVASPRISVESFVFECAVLHGHRAVLVIQADHLLGLVTLADVHKVEREAWTTTPLEEIMSTPPLWTVTPESDLAVALELMVTHSIHQLPAVTAGHVVGMINRADILRMLQLRDQLHLGSLRPRSV